MSNIDELNLGLKWYVAHTYSGYEKKVKTNLERIIANRNLAEEIVKIVVPTIIEQKEVEAKKADKDGKKAVEIKEKEKLIYPSYVFIKMVMKDDNWHTVRTLTGVTGFVGPGSRPTPLSDAEVASLHLETDGNEPPTIVEAKIAFKVGDTVVITKDPFTGFNAEIQSLDEASKTAHVLVKRGARDIPIDVDFADMQPINQ